eukprot:PLAT3188.3.p1 GENE.PLAT3188.3~~PLAT3188.3.p1  ORF type:complete len:282 (-),score=127.89 PLAT3188.3:112-831(-)
MFDDVSDWPLPERMTTADDSSLLLDESLRTMRGDHDRRRLASMRRATDELSPEEAAAQESRSLYDDYLQRARKEDLSDIKRLGLLYKSGLDALGRPIVVFVAKHLSTGDVSLERALLYIILFMDEIARKEYIVVYLHTNLAATPELAWLRKAYQLLSWQYHAKLVNMYVVHPTVWLKFALWLLTPMVSDAFWKRLVYIERAALLYNHFEVSQLILPDEVLEYDEALLPAEEAAGEDAGL